jgi:hypothetical protein
VIRHSVSSSNLVSVGFEADEGATTGTLEVEFRRGEVYQYSDVPENVFQEVLFAASPGKALMASVVGRYESTKL